MIPKERLLEKRFMTRGHIIKIYSDDECTKFMGYAELVKPINQGSTFIMDEERFYEDEEVYFAQRWMVRFLRPDDLPPFTDKYQLLNQKFIQGRETNREFYYLMGTWKKLKYELSKDDPEKD